jgi:hypothetical protein
MKSLVLLWRQVAEESATWCRTSTILDYKTVQERSNAEGLSFLTITLPRFGKDFEKSLDLGYIGTSSFTSFKKVRGGRIPAFLQGLVGQVFDRQTGRLVAEPSTDAIRSVRQLTLMFGKVLVDCTPARKKAAVQGFIDCEREVRSKNEALSDELVNQFAAMSWTLFGNIFDAIERELAANNILPKHGPGATADRLRGNAKFDLQEWPLRLNHSFPFEDYGLPNDREEFLSRISSPLPSDPDIESDGVVVTFPYPEQERPVKVTLVPKTLEKPRIIAIEPTAMQYTQQALLEQFVRGLESRFVRSQYFSSTLNRVFKMIGFTDQVPNQDLAREGSLNQELATLDLSEASDRVSNLHVMAMFSRFPRLLVAIQDCRSTKAVVPSGEIIPLAKFASMGSALCFPMEAMVFLTVIFLGIQKELNRTLTAKDILSFVDRVRVYGDDLIIPVEYVQSVSDYLVLLGYKVNNTKSFWTGRFRESCGKEYFAGVDVSIERVRMVFPQKRTDVQEIVSLVSLRNRLAKVGYVDTASWLDKHVEKLLPHYPLVRPTSPILGRHSMHPSDYQIDKMDKRTMAPLVKGFVVSSTSPISPISGTGALLKYFLKRGSDPLELKHLERQGRPHAVDIKLRWSPPF